MRQFCKRKGVEIIEAETCKDHIHMLVSISPKLSVSQFVGYLKERVVCWFLIDMHIKNIDMVIENFGVTVFTLIQLEEIKKS